MTYPEAVNLPFNREIIRKLFSLGAPDSDPGGPGWWIIVRGGELVVLDRDGRFDLVDGELPPWCGDHAAPVFIGLLEGRPLRAVAVARAVELPSGYRAEPFNATEDLLDDRLLTLGGVAHQILAWERNSSSCSACGNATERMAGSWGRRCRGCGREHYPHIHPCIIVLVRRNDEFLLVRKAVWPAGRYGLVAGFVDFGESLEECVVREVREETGLEVTNIRYVGSQNWPFPSQLMAGFVADYAGGEVNVGEDELEDARWFCIGNLPAVLPGKRSIARWIIDRYALGAS
jgi:NAD+ diphosphatase